MSTALAEVMPAEFERRRPEWLRTLVRLWRDRWAAAALVLVTLVISASFAGAPLASALLGHNGTDLLPYAANIDQKPVGPWTWVPDVHNTIGTTASGDLAPAPPGIKRTLLIFGADGPLGRDEFIRVLDAGKSSLEIAIGGVLIAALIGVPFGLLAGYYRGLVETAVTRFTDALMAFPLMLFLIFASIRLDSVLDPIGYGNWLPRGVFAEALLIGVFTSFYPARLVRAQLLPLRDAEFVEAAQMVGATGWRIIRSHLLPHVRSTLLVWAAFAAATNILLEVGLSFIGAGVQPETPTWGSLLSTTWGTLLSPQTYNSLQYTPWQTVFPTAAMLIAVVSLNQLAEGLRRALDPWAGR